MLKTMMTRHHCISHALRVVQSSSSGFPKGGADAHAKDDHDNVAFGMQQRLFECVAKWLVQRCADINAKDTEGLTPLYLAFN
jgi:ankyrin repeat protein